MPDYEQIQQENAMWPRLATGSMADSSFMDQQRNSDYLDAMADIAAEMEEAMRESSQDEWDGVEEISSAERNACDHYNERYVIND
jgi:hypothetical protein